MKKNQSKGLVHQNSACVAARMHHELSEVEFGKYMTKPCSSYSAVILFERPRHVRLNLFPLVIYIWEQVFSEISTWTLGHHMMLTV